jgi:hypothetical protein
VGAARVCGEGIGAELAGLLMPLRTCWMGAFIGRMDVAAGDEDAGFGAVDAGPAP